MIKILFILIIKKDFRIVIGEMSDIELESSGFVYESVRCKVLYIERCACYKNVRNIKMHIYITLVWVERL